MFLKSRNDIKQLNMSIARYSYVNLSSRWHAKNNTSVYTRIYFVEEGDGYLQMEEGTVLLEPGYVYMVPSNLRHTYGCTRLKKLYFMLKLTCNDGPVVLSSVGKICKAPWEPKKLQKLLKYCLADDCQSAICMRQMLSDALLLLLTENSIPPIPLTQHSPLVTEAIKFIQSNPRSSLTVSEVSAKLFVSESKLRNEFLAQTGENIGHYIDRQIMKQAKLLLSDPNLSINQISSRLGFCDQFYFSRQFKKHHGITPSEHRKSLRQEIAP